MVVMPTMDIVSHEGEEDVELFRWDDDDDDDGGGGGRGGGGGGDDDHDYDGGAF